jgi:N-acetylmuramoyl-L-alanine amidase
LQAAREKSVTSVARIAAITAALLIALAAAGEPGVPKVVLAGVECSFSPPGQIVDGQLLAPIGPALAPHGVTITPAEDGKSLRMSGPWGAELALGAADGLLEVDGEPLERLTPPRLVDGRWLLPVRAVCEALGFFVRADETRGALLVEPRVVVTSLDEDAKGIRLVLQCAGHVEYECRRLSGPERLVVDLRHAALTTPAQERVLSSDRAAKVRWSQFSAGPEPVARIVFELTGRHPFRVTRPAAGRIVVQIGDVEGLPPPSSVAAGPSPIQVIGASVAEDGWSAVILSDGPLEYSLSALRKPYRLVIDCPKATLATRQSVVRWPKGIIGRVRMMPLEAEERGVRIVLDLRSVVHFTVGLMTEPMALVVTFRRARLQEQRIVVDPGHGGNDPGARHRGVSEKTLNLDIARRLARLLREAGAEVLLTREEDVFVELYDRPARANAADASLFVSIHCNAMPRPNVGRGTETYYCNDNSVFLALAMQEALCRTLRLKDGGIRRRGFVVVRESKMPATLVEVAYLNTDAEWALLTDEAFRQAAAEAMFEGLKDYVEGRPFEEQSP